MSYKIYKGLIPANDKLNTEEVLSFLGGYQTVLLSEGTILWRFVSQKIVSNTGAFWIEPETMKIVMEYFHFTNNFSQGFKKEYIRNSLAIMKSWSHLNYRLKIMIRKEIICYVGKIAPQKENIYINDLKELKEDTVRKNIESRLGGQTQYIIPRFRKLNINNEWVSIEHFAHV